MVSRRALILCLAGAGPALSAPAAAQTWRTYRNPRFGTTIEYPDRFRPGRPPDNGAGLGFTASDTASFSVYGSHNALDHDIKGLEAFVRENLTAGERITYSARGANWFVLAGVAGNDMIFYDRHLLSHGGRIVNGFQMLYPSRLKALYDPIVTRMSRSLRAGRGDDTEGNP
jgi:serine/threonine-protein kinase